MASFIWPPQGGSGTVTSIGLTAPSSILSVSGSPVTGSGVIALSLVVQNANTVFAGPTTGAAAAPTFRALVTADLPFVLGNLTDSGTDGITVTGGTGAIIGSGVSLSQHVASATNNGYLSSTDWSTFNAKQAALTFGDLTDVGTDGITITGGTGAVIGSGTSISQHVAGASNNGYLSSTDWSTFNAKQPAGSYITALTGDGTASGPGSVALTLATVNASVGSFTNASLTVNAKGLITAASSGTAPVTSISVASANGFAGSSSGGATPALTLSTTITGILQGNGTAISAATTTGSGNVVLATSPTLVTPALGTPSALVGTNISGTGASFTAGKATAPATGTANGAVTLDGSGNFQSVAPGTSGNVLMSTGSIWASSPNTITPFNSEIWVTNGNGYGGSVSGDGATRNFATVQRNNGTDITYNARTTTTGDNFVINTAGTYSMSYSDNYNTAGTQGISLNASSGSTAIASLAINQILAINRTGLANYEGNVSATIHCAVNDVIRAQTGADPGGTPDIASFRITRVG